MNRITKTHHETRTIFFFFNNLSNVCLLCPLCLKASAKSSWKLHWAFVQESCWICILTTMQTPECTPANLKAGLICLNPSPSLSVFICDRGGRYSCMWQENTAMLNLEVETRSVKTVKKQLWPRASRATVQLSFWDGCHPNGGHLSYGGNGI